MKKLLLALLLTLAVIGCHKHRTGKWTPPPTPPAPPAVISCLTEVCRISCVVPTGIRGELNLALADGARVEIHARERLASADILTLELPVEPVMLRCTNTVNGETVSSDTAGPFQRRLP